MLAWNYILLDFFLALLGRLILQLLNLLLPWIACLTFVVIQVFVHRPLIYDLVLNRAFLISESLLADI